MADGPDAGNTPSAPVGNPDTTAQNIDFIELGKQLAAGAMPKLGANAVSDMIANGGVKALVSAVQFVMTEATRVATKFGEGVAKAEDTVAPLIGGFTAPMVAGMFGSDVDASIFARKSNSEGRNAAAAALVDAFFSALVGDASGPIEPDDAGARRVAAAGLHAAMEGWFLAAIPEIFSDLLPFDVGHFTAFTRLPDEVIGALGIGRLVRRALTPWVNAVATTPLTWKTNKEFRPTKLPANVAIKQFLRGQWTRDELDESLARDGYRDEDIDALINDARKFEPIADLALRVWLGITTQDDAVQTLGDQGFDQQTASKLLISYGFRQLDPIHRRVAAAAIAAYVEGRVGQSERDAAIAAVITNADEAKALRDAADAERELRVVPLSPAEAEACVLANILPIGAYTDALIRAGRSPDAVDALELLLRYKIDKQRTIEQLRAEQQAARDAAAKAKAAAVALHQQTVQDAAQKKALGALATLDRAYVHGLIPIDRVTELLALDYPPDTVAIYVADLEQRHAAYVKQQQAAAAATKRAKGKGLSVGALRTAYLNAILTADQVRQALSDGGLEAGDVEVLVATWQREAGLKAAAEKVRADALTRSRQKRLSLAEAEILTVNGHWTIDAFNSYVAALGYDAGDVAHLDTIVQDRIAKLKAAAGVRRATSAASPAKGLTLGQIQRAVVLGDRSLTDLQSWLVSEGFTPEAVSVLVAETQEAVNAADAARARRAAPATAEDGRPIPVSDVTRAARLGLLSPGDYQAALARRGFSPDAIALELQLLAAEIAQAKRPAPAAGSATAAIVASGASPIKFAELRHVTIDGELAGRGLSLAEVESAVKGGELTIDAYQAWLERNGYGPADAELLRALLAAKLGG